MRAERLYLKDIVEAADAIASYLANLTHQQFVGDDRSRSATAYRLIVIGEAAGQLSAALRGRYPAIPWSDIVGLRNIAVHAYHNLHWEIIWATATHGSSKLRAQILSILEAEDTEN